MENKLNNLTILVNTCDKYDDLWQPFFKLLKKYGAELVNCPIVLNADKKQYHYEDLNITCPNNYETNESWGKRIKNCLKTIKTDYVLFLLDDFFLQKVVDIETIKNCINWLDKNDNVACFNFISLESAQIESQQYKNFCEIPAGSKYRLNAQAAIWKKSVLNDSLLDCENAWEWEILGNIRNRTILKGFEIYALKYGERSPYDYNFIDYEHSNKNSIKVYSAIMRGKWLPQVIEKCFNENDITIDYSVRGIYTTPIEKKDNIVTKFFKLTKRIIRRLLRPFNKQFNKLVKKPIREFKKTLKTNKQKASTNC